jgi:hypothetical protein
MACLQGFLLDVYRKCPQSAYRKFCPVLQTMLVVLALTGVSTTAAHAEAGEAVPAAVETDPSRISSERASPARLRFDLDKLDQNIYGLAYHPDREKVKRENLDNQVNPGLALHYELRNTERGITFAEIGAYRDSGRNTASFLALGYQYKVGEHWGFGGAVAAMNSKTYNNGVSFVGMFPLVTYDFGPLKVNAVYFPKVANYNEVAAFGLYVSVPLGRWIKDSAQKQ